MKVNEAPEKLYIVLNELTEDGRTFVLDHRVDYPICTEYTRTDTFIEKVCEFIRKGGNRGDAYIVTEFGEEIFNFVQFAEDIKNYMKDE